MRKGTVLAEIEPEDYQIRVTTAKARIDQARFEEIVARHPRFAVDLMKVMAERLRRAECQAA